MRKILAALIFTILTAITLPTPQASATSVLGTFYDGASGTGASFSIIGDLCNGGGLNLPTSWNDRISSVYGGCGHIYLYRDANYGGPVEIVAGGSYVNLVSLNNQVSSIKFFG